MPTDLMNSAITIQKATHSKISEVDYTNLSFGKNFTDHMLVAEYIDGEWTNVAIKPYDHLSLSPATSVFHYGQAIFEGMKAYKLDNGDLSLFRPDKNWERFNISAARMSMPEIPEWIFY